jgi:hypothetical protein
LEAAGYQRSENVKGIDSAEEALSWPSGRADGRFSEEKESTGLAISISLDFPFLFAHNGRKEVAWH